MASQEQPKTEPDESRNFIQIARISTIKQGQVGNKSLDFKTKHQTRGKFVSSTLRVSGKLGIS